jgi:hypothetical protein
VVFESPQRGVHPLLEKKGRRVPGHEDAPFCTFLKRRRSPKPGWRPSGLGRVDKETLARWQADGHRFPPYQYQLKYMVREPGGILRVPTANEREVLLGLVRGHTLDPLPGSIRKDKQLCEDLRCELLGNAFSCISVAMILGPWCWSVGLLKELPEPDQCRGGLSRDEKLKASAHKAEAQGLQAARPRCNFIES